MKWWVRAAYIVFSGWGVELFLYDLNGHKLVWQIPFIGLLMSIVFGIASVFVFPNQPRRTVR